MSAAFCPIREMKLLATKGSFQAGNPICRIICLALWWRNAGICAGSILLKPWHSASWFNTRTKKGNESASVPSKSKIASR